MKKTKYLIMALFIGILLFLIPNISLSATEEYTYSDTKQGIEWSYQLDSTGNVINLQCKTTSITGTVTIPSKIDNKNVISLKGGYYNGAFKDCAGLTGITIPNTITTIGNYAFYNCTGLKTVTIPDSVTSIGTEAFSKCTGITSITLSKNLTSIGTYAFDSCSGLKSLVIPDSVTNIGEGAFRYCSGLKELTLSKNITKIADETFEGCSGLTSARIPNSVTTIEGSYKNIDGAFGDCKNLEKVLIPDSVATIGVGAFRDCDKLTIYGNDGMSSKEYAEENEIPFDYIANWDKKDSGADITPPTVKSIEVNYDSVLKYNKDDNKSMYIVPAGAKLVINAEFSEVIEGTTVPTLTIKFGDGKNIKVTEGTVGGSIITYVYTVQNTDKGVMTAVDFSGGNIKDASGNSATLSCPALSIQYFSGDFVYANGTATNNLNSSTSNSNSSNTNNSSNTSNSNSTNTNNSSANNSNNSSSNNSNSNNSSASNSTTTNGGTNNNNSTTNKTNTNKVDTTTATGKLPQTGVGIGLTATIVIVLAVGTFAFFKYKQLKGI